MEHWRALLQDIFFYRQPNILYMVPKRRRNYNSKIIIFGELHHVKKRFGCYYINKRLYL